LLTKKWRKLLRRNPQHLAGTDQVRIGDLVPVGIEDRLPRIGVAVELLSDLRQRVAGDDRIGLVASRRRRAAALDVAEIGRCRLRWCRRRTAVDVGESRFAGFVWHGGS